MSDALLRALARLTIRGPQAPYVIGDLEESYRRDLDRGMSPTKARVRYVANVAGSGLSLARARVHLPRRVPLPSMIDLKLGWRMLRKTPLLTAVAVLSLAIGIPVGMAPMHVMDAFDAPPPVEEGERLMGLRYADGAAPTTTYELGLWRETLTSYEGIAGVREVEHNLSAVAGVATPVSAAEVTGLAFPLLRVQPLFGRTLQPADEEPGAPPVVVLGYDVWRSRFGAAADMVGATVRVGGEPHTVVGVMPEGFAFPIRHDMWLPLRERIADEPGRGGALKVFGRLADGVTEEEAQTELAAVHGRLAAQHPEVYEYVTAEVVDLTTFLNGFPKGGLKAIQGLGGLPAVWVFQTIALVLLMLACANVGLLIFARTASRSGELAMRTALGASRGRIVGQVATEAFVLALLAAGLGLLVMHYVPNRFLTATIFTDQGGLPWWIDLGLTPMTVVRALLLAVLSAAIAAVFPALRVTGKGVRRNVQQAAEGGYGIRFGGVWSVLVVADVAVAVTAMGLIVAIGGQLASIASPSNMAGFAAHEYLAVQVGLAEGDDVSSGSPEAAELLASTQRLLVERLEAETGVIGVAVAEELPRMDHGGGPLEVEGHTEVTVDAARTRVDPDFFEALGQPILAGRDFETSDLAGERSAVIVNTVFVQRVMGGQNPVGRRVRFLSRSGEEPTPWYEIVGVVGDLGMDLVQPENASGVYHPALPGEMSAPWMAVRLTGDPADFVPRVREIAADVEPSARIAATPLDEVYPGDWYLMRGVVAAWALFVAVLLGLAASGIYAIMAFAVAQRRREIGIRAALGARTADIVSTIGRRAAFQLGTGALIGMPLAGLIYFGIQQGQSEGKADPTAALDAILVGVVPGSLLVLLVGLLACTVPLRRALQVTPTEAIKGG